MTKQKEIREGIAQSIFERFTNGHKPWEKCTQKHKDIFLRRADLILTYLRSQGVVIKVDRELPSFVMEARDWDSVERIKNKLTGYVVVEPLIEEHYSVEEVPEIKEARFSGSKINK